MSSEQVLNALSPIDSTDAGMFIDFIALVPWNAAFSDDFKSLRKRDFRKLRAVSERRFTDFGKIFTLEYNRREFAAIERVLSDLHDRRRNRDLGDLDAFLALFGDENALADLGYGRRDDNIGTGSVIALENTVDNLKIGVGIAQFELVAVVTRELRGGCESVVGNDLYSVASRESVRRDAGHRRRDVDLGKFVFGALTELEGLFADGFQRRTGRIRLSRLFEIPKH